MKTVFSTKAFLVLATTVLLATVSIVAQTPGEQKSLTGVVSDAMCGSTHMAKDKSPAECTRMCVKDGQKYALVADKHVYTLEGHEVELDKYAARKVTVRGMLNGNTLSVASVAPAVKEKKASSPPEN
jgi:hypothetical protein